MPKERREPIAKMDPLLITQGSKHRPELTDLALDLAQKCASLRRSLPPSLMASLASLVRAMNCYYSNLIEGHNTHPIDIERALNNDYSKDAHKRDLQLEAKAHMAVQAWIDQGGLRANAQTVESIAMIHRRFCEQLPAQMLWMKIPGKAQRLAKTPGALRDRDVQVGRHVPISAAAVPRFLQRFEQVYAQLGKTETIQAAAASHHRLLWIHPFLDGNGRVARLMSHALLLRTLETGAVWSIARGLARNVDTYKAHLAACDQTRRNDLDGRGNLSEESLVAFSRFFLTTCIDQVTFMERLMQADKLHTRIAVWAEEEIRLGLLPAQSGRVLQAILYRGELSRGDSSAVVATGERQARRVVSALVARGVLTSDGIRAPLRLVMPASLASRWLPGLFPDQT